MYIKAANHFLVIQFATVALYLNLIIKRRPNRRAGQMEPPKAPTAARYYRGRKIVLIHLYACVGKRAHWSIRGYFLNLHFPNIEKKNAHYPLKSRGNHGQSIAIRRCPISNSNRGSWCPISVSFRPSSRGPDSYP